MQLAKSYLGDQQLVLNPQSRPLSGQLYQELTLAPQLLRSAHRELRATRDDLECERQEAASARRAKATLDLRRMAPGAHKPDAAGSPLSVLAGAGTHLSLLAGTDPSGFAKKAAALPALHRAAIAELEAIEATVSDPDDKLRLDYAVRILSAAA